MLGQKLPQRSLRTTGSQAHIRSRVLQRCARSAVADRVGRTAAEKVYSSSLARNKRDATATASTSGNDHAAPVLAAAAAAAAASRTQSTKSNPALKKGAPTTSKDATPTPSSLEPGSSDAPSEPPSSLSSSAPSSSLPPSNQRADKELHDEIKACDQWADVLEIVADELASLTPRTSVQALSKLLALTKSQGANVQQRVVQHEAFKSLLGVLYQQLPSMNPIQLSNSLYALAVLKVDVPTSVLQQYALQAGQRSDHFFPRDLSTIVHAFATLKAHPGQVVLDKLGFRALALMQMQLQPQAASDAGPTDGSSISSTSPSSQSSDTPGSSSGSSSGSSPGGGPAASARTFQPSSSSGAGPGSDAAFQPIGISMLLHSLSILRYKNKMLLNAAIELMLGGLDAWGAQGVANVVAAVARLQFYHSALIRAALGYYRTRAQQFKPQEACNLLSALVAFRYHPEDVLPLITQQLASQSKRLQPADIGSLFHALGAFVVPPSEADMARLCSAAQAMLPRFNALELANTFWGLGLIGGTRQPLFARLADCLADMFERNELDDSLLRQVFQGFICAKLAESEEEGQDQDPQEAGDRQQSDADLGQDLDQAESGKAGTPSSSAAAAAAASRPTSQRQRLQRQRHPTITLPPLMLDATRQAWMTSLHGPEQPHAATSSVQQRVVNILRELRVRHDVQRPTRDGLAYVDIALKTGQGQYVALQIVREHEHSCNTGQLLGPVQLERAVLEKNGWVVKHMRAKDFLHINEAMQPKFVAEFLAKVGIRVAAANAPAAAKDRPAAAAASSLAAARSKIKAVRSVFAKEEGEEPHKAEMDLLMTDRKLDQAVRQRTNNRPKRSK